MKQNLREKDFQEIDLDALMQDEILEPILQKNYDCILKNMWDVIDKVNQSMDIEQEVLLDKFLVTLEDQQNELDEFFLKTLVSSQQKYFQPAQYGSQIPSLIEKASVINEFLNRFYLVLVKFCEKMHYRYEVYEYFVCDIDNICDQIKG